MRKEGTGDEWSRRRLASQKNQYYYKGFQHLRKSDLSNSYRPLDQKPIHYTLNEYAFWINVNVMKWMATRPEYRIKGMDDTEDAEAAANKLIQIARHYDDRDWNRTEVIKAAKTAQLEGHLVTYVYHDPTFSERKAFRPVTERQTIKIGPDAYRCADCDAVGEVKEGAQPVCKHCGSERLAITEVPEIESDIETGKEEVQCGDVTDRRISIFNITWSARNGLKKSNLVLWEEQYASDELEATYEGIELPKGELAGSGLQMKAQLSGDGGTAKHVLSRLWVEPSRYKNIELKEDVTPVVGEPLPAALRRNFV